MTAIKNGTREERHWEEYKRVWALIGGERRLLKRLRDPLRHFVRSHDRVWTGVATLKQRSGRTCRIADVGKVRRQLVRAVRQFFEEVERRRPKSSRTAPGEKRYPVEHFFSVVEETFKKRKGEVQHHVHVHFLFLVEDAEHDPLTSRWYRSFLQRFGQGSGVQKVKSKQRFVSYLFKRQERKFLVDHGLFANWCEQVKGTQRVAAYGSFVEQMREHAKKKVAPVMCRHQRKLRVLPVVKKKKRPGPVFGSCRSHTPGVTAPDTYLGKRRTTNPDGSWSYWDFFRNKQSATAALYRRLGIKELADEATGLRGYLSSNYHTAVPQKASRPTITCQRATMKIPIAPTDPTEPDLARAA